MNDVCLLRFFGVWVVRDDLNRPAKSVYVVLVLEISLRSVVQLAELTEVLCGLNLSVNLDFLGSLL